ncbi:hypothetical protein BGX27_009919 [Mortierella sp. AM989]|nr:hypothetical protein BGX27_009919 [Mortierella sp. AM989]
MAILTIALRFALTCLSQAPGITSAAPSNLHTNDYSTRSDSFGEGNMASKKATHKGRKPIPGYIAAIVSPTEFCFLLPPDPKKETVAEAEDHAVAYCTVPNVKGAEGAKVFPENFIVSAHYKKDESAGWVQTTGLLNPTVYGMSMNDDGGQYDVKAPRGASCAGYNSFVNLIEPSSNRYCIRCCMSKQDCNVGISEKGCHRIVPGDYSLGGSVQGTLLYPESDPTVKRQNSNRTVSSESISKNKAAKEHAVHHIQQASSNPSSVEAEAFSSKTTSLTAQSDANILGCNLSLITAKVLGTVGVVFAFAF